MHRCYDVHFALEDLANLCPVALLTILLAFAWENRSRPKEKVWKACALNFTIVRVFAVSVFVLGCLVQKRLTYVGWMVQRRQM